MVHRGGVQKTQEFPEHPWFHLVEQMAQGDLGVIRVPAGIGGGRGTCGSRPTGKEGDVRYFAWHASFGLRAPPMALSTVLHDEVVERTEL